jgi:hypothetical protein
MVIKNSKVFNIGALFAITFIGVLFTIFSPVFAGKNERLLLFYSESVEGCRAVFG